MEAITVRGLLTVSKKIIYQNIAFNSLLMLPEGNRANSAKLALRQGRLWWVRAWDFILFFRKKRQSFEESLTYIISKEAVHCYTLNDALICTIEAIFVWYLGSYTVVDVTQLSACTVAIHQMHEHFIMSKWRQKSFSHCSKGNAYSYWKLNISLER